MENLSQLLELAQSGNEFVLETESGDYNKMADGATGTLRSLNSRLLFELFGEYPLSEGNQKLLSTLYKLKLDKDGKAPVTRKKRAKKAVK